MIEIARSIVIIIGCHNGLGRPASMLSPYQMMQVLKFIYIQIPLATFSGACGRIAFAIFLLGIVGKIYSWQKVALQIIIALQVVVSIIVTIQLVAHCGTNMDALWDPSLAAEAHCQSLSVQENLGYLQTGNVPNITGSGTNAHGPSAVNCVCDLCLTIIPLFIVKALRGLQLRARIGLVALLCLSFFAFTASLIRGITIDLLKDGFDIARAFAVVAICSSVENNIVIIAASIPMLKPLIRYATQALPSPVSKISNSHRQSKSSCAKEDPTVQELPVDLDLVNMQEQGIITEDHDLVQGTELQFMRRRSAELHHPDL